MLGTTAATSTRARRTCSSCANPSAWCSSSLRRFASPSATTSCSPPSATAWCSGKDDCDAAGRAEPARRRVVGRGARQARRERLCPLRRPAAAPVHRRARLPCIPTWCCSTSRAARSTPSPRSRWRRPSAPLSSRGICAIIVTHNMEQATRVSDNTAFLLRGRHGGDRPYQAPVQSTGGQASARLSDGKVRLII